MKNNVEMVQKQIKAFNKALSRSYKAGSITRQLDKVITDLIDVDRMTKSGYGKAGAKFLESLSTEELLAYSADIEQAKYLVDVSTFEFKIGFDVFAAKDPKSMLWKLFDNLMDRIDAAGLAFDSDDVKDVIDGEVLINYKDLAIQMNKYLNEAKNGYGLSDFKAWYESQKGLED